MSLPTRCCQGGMAMAGVHLARRPGPVAEDLCVMTCKDDKAQNPVCVAEGTAPQQQIGCVQWVCPVGILDDSPLKLVKPALYMALSASVCAQRLLMDSCCSIHSMQPVARLLCACACLPEASLRQTKTYFMYEASHSLKLIDVRIGHNRIGTGLRKACSWRGNLGDACRSLGSSVWKVQPAAQRLRSPADLYGAVPGKAYFSFRFVSPSRFAVST